MKILRKTSSQLFSRYWPYFILLFAVLLFFYPIFFGKVPIPGDFVLGVYSPWIDHIWQGFQAGVPVKNPILADVVSFTFPMQTLAITMMKAGQWPLWNPYILGGSPLLANFQSAPFAVTNIVYLFLDSLSGWTARIVLQHFLAALFSYFLLRHWKVSKVGSLSGGLFYAFGGFNLIWSQWNAHTLTAAFIPLIFLFEDRFLRLGKIRDGAFFSLSVALQIFSGYPQVVIYSLGAAGLLWVFNFKFDRSFYFRSVYLFALLLLGFAAASIQLIPAKELLAYSQRSAEPHPFEWAFLPWKKIITSIAPDYYGNHATGNWWGPQDYTSNTGFIGLVPLAFALIALQRRRKLYFLIALLVSSLLLSFPTFISIPLWKSGILGFQAASAHRALVLQNLSLSLLAGFGIDTVLQQRVIRLKTFLPIVLLLLGFLCLTFVAPYKNHQLIALRNLAFPLLFLVTTIMFFLFKLHKRSSKYVYILIAFGVFELFRFGWKYTPFIENNLVFPDTPVLSYLKQVQEPYRSTGAHVIPINLRMNYGISSLEGYDAVYPSSISHFLSAVNGSPINNLGRYGFVNNDTAPLLNMANVSYVISKKETDKAIPLRFKNDNYEQIPIDEPEVLLFKNKLAKPRSYFVYTWETQPIENTIPILMDSAFDLTNKVLIEGPLDLKQHSIGQGTVSYKMNTETMSILEVSTNNAGVLFTSDTYFPGWKAYIDGLETRILRANSTFRGIVVPQGKHEVTYLYRPESFFTGLKLSLISFCIIGFMIVIPLFKKA